MARQTFVLGRLYDIRVGVHVSWLAVYAFVTIALAQSLGLFFGAFCALALFAGVVVHELAHALVARRFGVHTSAITLFLFGGVATLEDEPPSPRAEALIALAGPAVSAVLGIVALVVLVGVERLVPGHAGTTLGLLFAYLALANGVLAVFNLLPAYPMDGGRVLRALLWVRRGDRDAATAFASRVGVGFALALVAAGVLAAAASRHVVYLWYAVLGGFLLRQSWAHDRSGNVEVAPAA
ncbi:MAG TPA: site-2 protease family protein [Candidatus Acidoferrum sp.]|nr:site-2 protease family protein [Candidatus Acidoferrum sp.]